MKLLGWIVGLLLLFAASAANAQVACTPGTQGELLAQFADNAPSKSITPRNVRNVICSEGPVLYAANYGVVADGTTSDDAALKRAMDACSALGTTLVLPAGRILLTGAGGQTIEARNCHLVGVGGGGPSFNDIPSYGSMLTFTSTSITPFNLGSAFAVSWVKFWYPNQTGAVVYPPTFAIVSEAVSWSFENLVVINSYKFIQHTAGSCCAGNVSDSLIFAVKSAWESPGQGDNVRFSNIHFTPGPWLHMCNATCSAAINLASAGNSIWHATSAGSVGNNLITSNIVAFAWRYGLLLDSGGQVTLSSFDVNFDNVGTAIDSSAGGLLAGGSRFNGNIICAINVFSGSTPSLTSNKPCFNMGSTGALELVGVTAETRGSFVESAGASVSIKSSSASGIGRADDGLDYYGIKISANSGTTTLQVQGVDFGTANPSTSATYGIFADPTVLTRAQVQNNSFNFFNKAIQIYAAPTTLVSGNASYNTKDSVTIVISGSDSNHSVQFKDNFLDKGPTATLGVCNGAGSAISGGFSGTLTPDSAAAASCTITLPWMPYGLSGNCLFFPRQAVGLSGYKSGTLEWTIAPLTGTFSNLAISFNCPGLQ